MPDKASSNTPKIDIDRRKYAMWVCLVVALGLRLLFWIATDRVWEDALITLRHAENAARGVGLTHHPAHGDPVHGFTSPISVLIPMSGEYVAPGSGMLVNRLLSLVATALTIFVGFKIATHPKVNLSLLGTSFFLGFLAIEFHQILFSMGGMETQWIVVITLLVLLEFLNERPAALGLACALTLWGRPDGVITVATVFTALVLCRRFREIPVTLLVCAVAYAPWLIFCMLYYGSFVPHTIIAKKVAFIQSFGDAPDWTTYISAWSSEFLRRLNFLRLWFSPVYGGTGSAINFIRGARPLQLIYFGFVCLGVWSCFRSRDLRLIPVFAVGFAAYMIIMLAQPAWWYILPWLNVVALLFAFGIEHASEWRTHLWWKRILAVVPCIFLALYAFGLTRTFPAERHIQLGIEEACRVKIGEWLEANSEPDDWIACECLGYVGSYSNRPILDYPGLSCPRTVAANRRRPEGDRSLMTLIHDERPEWLVLRPYELEYLTERFPETVKKYDERQRFSADAEHVKAIGDLMWADGFQLTIDEEFVVLQRNY